jgi:hypothetical protein
VRREQKPDNAQSRFGPERCEHVGVAGGDLGVVAWHEASFYDSIIMEIWKVNRLVSARGPELVRIIDATGNGR